jgi:tripartite motif-containing protein 71
MHVPRLFGRTIGGAIICSGVLLVAHPSASVGHAQSGRFSFPAAIALDRQGNVYVADAYGDRILKLSGRGQTLATWGKKGSALGQFDYPDGIALDVTGNAYVSDANNSRIQKLSPAGRVLAQWKIPLLAQHKFVGLNSVALDSHAHIYVSEFQTHQVVELGPNGSAVKVWHTQGAPYGLAVDASGHLYVAADVLQEFSLSGKILRTVGGASLHAGSVALDKRGNLYVTDVAHMKILELSPSGKVLAAWGSKGSKPGQFNFPQDIALDAKGDIYVADGNNSRIQKLSPSGKVLSVWT